MRVYRNTLMAGAAMLAFGLAQSASADPVTAQSVLDKRTRPVSSSTARDRSPPMAVGHGLPKHVHRDDEPFGPVQRDPDGHGHGTGFDTNVVVSIGSFYHRRQRRRRHGHRHVLVAHRRRADDGRGQLEPHRRLHGDDCGHEHADLCRQRRPSRNEANPGGTISSCRAYQLAHERPIRNTARPEWRPAAPAWPLRLRLRLRIRLASRGRMHPAGILVVHQRQRAERQRHRDQERLRDVLDRGRARSAELRRFDRP